MKKGRAVGQLHLTPVPSSRNDWASICPSWGGTGASPGRHQGRARCRKCCRYIAGSSALVDISITCSKVHARAAPEDSRGVRWRCFKSKPHVCLVRWPEDQGRVHRALPAGSAVHRRLLVNSTLAWVMAQVGIPGVGQGGGLLGLLVEVGGEKEVVSELLPSPCLPGSQQAAPGSASVLPPSPATSQAFPGSS